MNIYVVGTGGIGGYFGSLLAKGGLDVTFVARGAQYEAIKKNGLTINSVVGNFVVKPAKVIEHIKDIRDPDIILFCVKSYDLEQVAKEISEVATSKTTIITFQNGIDNDLFIKQYIPQAKIYPGIAYVIASRTEPGVISQTGGLRKLFFGDRNNSKNADLESIALLMQNAGVDATFLPDVTYGLWKKFLYILAFSGMTAICRSPIGTILSDPQSKSVYELCLKEVIDVATREGTNLPKDIFDLVMLTSINTAPDSKSSLLIDIENGRKNEIETLHGSLVKLADQLGIDIPINRLIYVAIKSLNQKL